MQSTAFDNGLAERLIGSIRRDCLDHVVVFNERHLRHLLNSYKQYYNEFRTHLSLDKDAPVRRGAQRVGVLPLPILGGLHHQYVRIRISGKDIGRGRGQTSLKSSFASLIAVSAIGLN